MGAVIFTDYWLFPRLGLKQYHAELNGLLFSIPTATAWLGTLAICFGIYKFWGVEIFFLGLPGWFIAVGLYIVMNKIMQR
jgi:hypothetical protein